MKIIIKKQQLGGFLPAQWLRRAGYTLIIDRQSGQESFVRRLSRDFYPRFHLYIKEEDDDTYVFNLHLDHKKASYQGQIRHSADYDGEMVKQEVDRLSALLLPLFSSSDNNYSNDILTNLKPSPPLLKKTKRSWWQKLFS